ncbi:MAG: DUF6033 family protein [Lachnospiraceae bacterium]|nr:DUF6033 family protein [Lachnospiraceae bacterium]
MGKIDGFGAYQDQFFKTAMKDFPGGPKGARVPGEKADGVKNQNTVKNEGDKLAVSSKKAAAETPELSEAAKSLLDELKQKYGNVDFMVANYSSDEEAQEILSRGTKEYSVLIEPELLEKMAADEETKNKYVGIIEDSMAKIDEAREELTKAGEENGGQVDRIGISISSDGTVSYFAELSKATAAQKERIEKNLEKKAEEKKEEEKKAEEKAAEEKLKGPKGSRPGERPEYEPVKTTTVKANSLEDLMKQVQSVSWDKIGYSNAAAQGARFDFTV